MRASSKRFAAGEIVKGVVLEVRNKEVLVDIGYKSEGVVSRGEFMDPEAIKVGDEIDVLIEKLEDKEGMVILSHEQAEFKKNWDRIRTICQEGGTVSGKVKAIVKGGLIVHIGVEAFLPASQIDIIPPKNLTPMLGNNYDFKVVKINEDRRNVVLSRRELIEAERSERRGKLLGEMTPGDIRKGTVKNITDFGAFIDLNGLDGLLHITDMSWGRIGHPTEMVKIDQEIEVKVLHVDREKEKIALGLKQLVPSPWDAVGDKYPVSAKINGEVVNVMSYGAFVKLEDGIEGLVHISEMSWTKRINHPTEIVQIGDKVDVVVLGINKEKQEISLGMKQTLPNPWDDVAAKYPPGANVKGVVRNLTNYGAFIELEEGVDALLHVSDMSWTRKISHASEMLKKGQELECQVLTVDQERKRIALGLKQLASDPWATDIPSKFQPGEVVKGKVTKITNFGVFVELAPELEGLLHISELGDTKVENPEELVKVGDELEVRVLRVDTDDRKIGLSRKLTGEIKLDEPTTTATPVPREQLKGGMGEAGSGPLFTLGGGDKQ